MTSADKGVVAVNFVACYRDGILAPISLKARITGTLIQSGANTIPVADHGVVAVNFEAGYITTCIIRDRRRVINWRSDGSRNGALIKTTAFFLVHRSRQEINIFNC